MVAYNVEGLANLFTDGEVTEKQAPLLVRISFEDTAFATHRLDQVLLIKPLFDHMANSMEPDPISPSPHERPNLI